MSTLKQKPFLLFIILVFIIAIPLCVFPINLFAGEIIELHGLAEYKIEAPLSLSYFFGLGFNPGDLKNVKDFYLLPSGYITLFGLVLGFPALIAYRIHLSNKK